jgi:hypothetical protein
MKKLLFSTLLSVAFMTTLSKLDAQPTSSGSFGMTGTIDPSICLTFIADGSGATLTSGGGTGTATLALGHIAAYGETPPTNVTNTLNASGASATSFKVSTPVDVLVMEANTASANYTLTAELNSVDSTNTWSVGGHEVTGASAAQITATGAYGTAVSYAFAVSIPFSNTASLSLSNTINFVATAN